MIWISRTSSGLLIQKDALDIQVDAGAVPLALGALIHEITDSGRATNAAYARGHADGLLDGRMQAERERMVREAKMDDIWGLALAPAA